MEFSLLENSPDVSRNAGKTLMLEALYKYTKSDAFGNEGSISDTNSSRTGRSKSSSSVFRPAGRQDDFMKSKDIIYRNSYRFDIVKSRSKARATWIHLVDGPDQKIPGYSQNEI